MKKRMQNFTLSAMVAAMNAILIASLLLVPLNAHAASPFACRSMSRVGPQSMEGPLTLTCSSCTDALLIPGAARIAFGGDSYIARTGVNTLQITNSLLLPGNLATNGYIYNAGAANGGSLAFNDPTRWLSTTTALLESSTTNTATDTAFTLTTLPTNTLAAGDKLLSLQNATVEKAYFNHLGALTTPSINFSASRWEDVRVPLLTAKPGASSPPVFKQFKNSGSGSTGAFAYHFEPTTTEEVFFSVQLPHGYKEGTALKPHVHWSPTTTGVGNVVFDLECTVAAVNGTFANTTTITVTDAASTVAYKHQLSSFTDISGSGLGISSMLMCRFARVGGNVADTYAADIAVLEIDFHYEIDTVGSASATAK